MDIADALDMVFRVHETLLGPEEVARRRKIAQERKAKGLCALMDCGSPRMPPKPVCQHHWDWLNRLVDKKLGLTE